MGKKKKEKRKKRDLYDQMEYYNGIV